MTTSSPFGAPGVLARPILTAVPTSACASPAVLYRRLRREPGGRRGGCLLESSDTNRSTVRRSIIAARCPLRVELIGNQVRIVALDPGGTDLERALRARLPSHRVDDPLCVEGCAVESSDDRDDGARLRAPCVLDPLRLIAGFVADEDESVPIAPGLFGVFGYEIVDRFEALPPRRVDPLGEPDASFVLATDQILFDHERSVVHVITRHLATESYVGAHKRHARYLALLSPRELAIDRRDRGQAPVRGVDSCPDLDPDFDLDSASDREPDCGCDVTDEAFCDGVKRVRREIECGEIFQAVLSRGFRLSSRADSFDVYAELRESNPSPYMFHLELADGSLLGASPETFLRCEDGTIELRPIAGTVPRGDDAESDRRLALQLLLDAKEQAEHAMLLDLARNDVCRVAEPGTCRVVQQFEIEKFSHVQHLVSRVRGRLGEGLDALHAYRAAANMGTLTGAPKLAAMELIREIEPTSRGFYGGAAGYLLQDGSFDSCIVIRSLRQKGDVYTTRAGAGIVLDSDPARELEETTHKARACIEAVMRATASVRAGLAS